MKIKTISRSETSLTRGASTEPHKSHKNADPLLHPFERAREYTRAVRAVKMERMFAKPFIGAMDNHADTVTAVSTSPTSTVALVTGAADGEVIVWDLATQKKLWAVYAHSAFVKSVSVARDGETFFSCGDDKTVKQWRMESTEALASGARAGGAGAGAGAGSQAPYGERSASGDRAGSSVAPVKMWSGRAGFTGIDCHWAAAGKFATSSTMAVELWDASRAEPVTSFEWGADTVTSVAWNPAEASVLASTSTDRGVVLYDARMSVPLRKVTLSMSANAVAWNPREPMNFTVASEDSALYSFDMRKLDATTAVHRDHVGPVLDVHYSPTGREFVSGSYDRTVRIWPSAGAGSGNGRSRDVYHTSRMQRVFCVRFTPDARFLVSGSDDTNVRVWKARASEALARQLPKERAAADYRTALKKKFGHMPEIHKIATFRRVPSSIKNAGARVHEEKQVERRKAENVRRHSKPGAIVEEGTRKKPVLRVQS